VDVVLVRAGALGDLVLLRRAVAALRAAGHRLRLLAPAAGAALVGPGPGEVDALLPWGAPETAAILASLPTPRGVVADALAEADVVIAWTRRADVAAALGRLARRILTHDPAPPAGVHASRWLARAVEPLGMTAALEPPLLSFTAAERDEAARRLLRLPSGFLAIHPGSGSASKNWPSARFFAFAERKAGGGPFLLALGPAETARDVPLPATAVVARDWPLRILGAAFARAGLYLGNDSGASHLAAAAGAPTLALFGDTDPATWSPVGPSVRTLHAADGIQGLGIDEVLGAAEELRLTSAGGGPPSG
jgi:heptosyltransferase-3